MCVGLLFLLVFCCFNLSAATIESSYLLSTGDKVKISVFGEPDLSITAQLDDTGKIAYPLLGEIQVKYMTLAELERYITSALKGRYLVNPKVTVSIVEYRAFFVNGEVNSPGGYAYRPALTVRKAVALAGGFTERASLDRMFIIREQDPQKRSNPIDLDTNINPGDIITVHEFKKIFVDGEVKQPGSYGYQLELTVRKAVALAGGFTARASENKISLIRETENESQEQEVNLEDSVLPGDTITVGERFF